MSARLVGEVANWLTTPAAAPLTPAERLVLVLIAERANEQTREMWRHKADTETLAERLARCTGLSSDALGDALRRLAARGLECRVAIGTDKRGRTVFATRGRATSFRLPELPASVSLPESSPATECPGPVQTIPVENPVDNSPQERSGTRERSGPGKTIREKGLDESRPLGPNGLDESRPYPYKSFPSPADLPLTPSPLPSRAEVEGTPRASPDGPQEFSQQEFAAAQGCLLGLPDLGAALLARAAREAPTAPREAHIIRAAQLAKEGTPA